MLEGSSLKSVIHNPNRFSVPYMIAFKNVKQFESNPEEGILDPLAFEEIILTFKAFNYIGDENVPKVLKYSGTMELESTIHVLRKGFAEIEGFLVDVRWMQWG